MVVFFVAYFLTWGFFDLVFGYGFNMTEELEKEAIILDLCINWQIENDICGMIYGNINNDNGEPQH